ncbi:hypothetical protein OCU04_011969 [Sclerotinia nivalis]|uniref:Uncharacterized protein n=1 Tax=Sclerotinia nivalis TaxID=352851 RepID=A0A9X0AA56_9HELO|nr:hypothetical protein OCU04_011969 [Sclerotinia nivalis]
MDHSKLTFGPKESAPVPQRQVPTAIQPQLPIVDENATANVESPTDTLNVIGATDGASAGASTSLGATLPSTSTSSSGMAPLLGSNSGSCLLISISATNSAYPKWREHTKEYLTHDHTRGVQVLPIEINSLAEFIRHDAVKAETSLPKLVGTCESEVVRRFGT